MCLAGGIHYKGAFNDVKDYLLDAFNKALIKFADIIPDKDLRGELKQLVEYLCYPLPEQRGHPKNINRVKQYDLERFVTKLDVLYRKAKFNIIKG